MMQKKLLLGAHMPISQGFSNAITLGEELGCTAIQIFTKSNRSWNAKEITSTEATKFQKTLKQSKIYPNITAHASYLINLASPKKDIESKSIKSLIEELHRCEFLGIPYLIIHPGSCLSDTKESCINRIANNINYVLSQTGEKVMILLENTAGQGTSVGSNLEDLKTIYDKINDKEKIGFCLDTCHAFAAGYDISTKETLAKTLNTINTTLDLNNIKIIHLNNSKTALGSNVDRHAKINQGIIPTNIFIDILKNSELKNIPKILETPIINDLKEYKEEIEMLKQLLDD